MAPNDANSSEFFSPAAGLTDGFAVGGTSNPPEPSVYPDFSLAEKGAEAPNMKDTEAVGGVGATSGAVPFAQLSTAGPEGYNTDGDPMVGGIGTPPKA